MIGPWTDETVERLRGYVAEGQLSMSQIAAALGLSRNAIIGKVHRLGLAPSRPRGQHHPPRLSPQARAEHRRARRLLETRRLLERAAEGPSAPAGPQAVPLSEADDLNIPLEQRRTLLELAFGDCRWPVGDPCSGDFFFCGAPALEGASYCPCHWARAHATAAELREQRRQLREQQRLRAA